jgi:hypothetical protein
MESNKVRQLAEDNITFILERAKKNEGRIAQEDAAAGQFFCRVVEAETSGGPYGTGYGGRADINGALAAAASAIPSGQ